MEQTLTNGASWYKYANQTFQRRAENGLLYLVTGCDKGSSWRITAFSNTSGGNDVFVNLMAAQLALAGVSYSKQWKVNSPAVFRNGPNASDWQTLERPSNSDQSPEQTVKDLLQFGTIYYHQLQHHLSRISVFARGYYM